VRFWWITLARGIVAVGLGIAIVAADSGRQNLVNFIAVYWLVGALLVLRFAFAMKDRPGWRVAALAGSIGIVTAILTLVRRWTGMTAAPITVPLGSAILLTGVFRVVGGLAIEERTGRSWTWGGLVLGTTEIVLGALVISSLWMGVGAAVVAAVAWAFVGGTLLILDGLNSYRLRSQAREEQ
jgi:uncharacterized membrane protein HdeD (DUF308 family)